MASGGHGVPPPPGLNGRGGLSGLGLGRFDGVGAGPLGAGAAAAQYGSSGPGSPPQPGAGGGVPHRARPPARHLGTHGAEHTLPGAQLAPPYAGPRGVHAGGAPVVAHGARGPYGPPITGSFTRVSGGGAGGSSLALQEAKRLNGELVRAPTVDHLFYLIDQRVIDFSHINSSTALHRLARLSKQEGLFTLDEMIMGPQGQQRAWAFERLMHSIESHLLEFNTQSLANIMWGMASLSYHPGDLLDLMSVESLKRIRSFNPQELANSVWALAKLSRFARFTHPQQQLVDAIAVEARRKLDAYNPQNLVNTVWAYATLQRHPGDAVLMAVAEHAYAKIAGMQRSKAPAVGPSPPPTILALSLLTLTCAPPSSSAPPQISIRRMSPICCGRSRRCTTSPATSCSRLCRRRPCGS